LKYESASEGKIQGGIVAFINSVQGYFASKDGPWWLVSKHLMTSKNFDNGNSTSVIIKLGTKNEAGEDLVTEPARPSLEMPGDYWALVERYKFAFERLDKVRRHLVKNFCKPKNVSDFRRDLAELRYPYDNLDNARELLREVQYFCTNAGRVADVQFEFCKILLRSSAGQECQSYLIPAINSRGIRDDPTGGSNTLGDLVNLGDVVDHAIKSAKEARLLLMDAPYSSSSSPRSHRRIGTSAISISSESVSSKSPLSASALFHILTKYKLENAPPQSRSKFTVVENAKCTLCGIGKHLVATCNLKTVRGNISLEALARLDHVPVGNISQYSLRMSRLISDGSMKGISPGEREEVENLIVSLRDSLPPSEGYNSGASSVGRSNSNGRGGRNNFSENNSSNSSGSTGRSNGGDRGQRSGRGNQGQRSPLDPRYNPPADGSSIPPPPSTHINFNVPPTPTTTSTTLLNNSVVSTSPDLSSCPSTSTLFLPSAKDSASILSHNFPLMSGHEISLGLMVNPSSKSVLPSDLISLYGQDPINNNNLQLLSVVVGKYCLGDDTLLDELEFKYQKDVKDFNTCILNGDTTGASTISKEMADTVRIIHTGDINDCCNSKNIKHKNFGHRLTSARRTDQESCFYHDNDNGSSSSNNSISLDVLKDDGATYTTISRKLVHALKAATIKLKQPVSLGAYSGVEERATETAIVTVSFRGFDLNGHPVIAKTVVRAIVVDTLQSAILLGGNLIKKLKIQVDLDTQEVRMFRGSNMMVTNCVPWGKVQQSIAETSSKVDSLCMFASTINSSLSTSTPASPSYSSLLESDKEIYLALCSSIKNNLEYPSSSCPLYTDHFDRNAGFFASSLPSSLVLPNYESWSEALGLPS
jgi:hypothetical protein